MQWFNQLCEYIMHLLWSLFDEFTQSLEYLKPELRLDENNPHFVYSYKLSTMSLIHFLIWLEFCGTGE